MAKQNLGMVTAYAYAVVGGYEGTEAEFEALLGNIATDLAEIENLTVIANTLPSGSSATASYDHGVLTLGIPKGDKGDTGAGATVTVGTTATGNPGTNASVINSGTTKDAVFNFTIPRGDTGNGIESIELTDTQGAVKTYTILFTDGNTTTFDVTDGEVTNATLTAVLADYAKIDGAYESMTVGNAEQLVSSIFEEDSVPYNFRTSGGSIDIGDRETDMVVGGTVAWNQFVSNGNFANGTTGWSAASTDVTISAANNILTAAIAGGTVTYAYRYGLNQAMTGLKNYNHKFLFSADVNPSESCKFQVQIHGGYGNYVTPTVLPAGTKTKVACVMTSTMAFSNNFTIFPALSGTAPQMTIQYSNIVGFDLTQMFGTTIADYIYSLEQATAGAGVAWFRKLFPKPYYTYNAGELMSVNTSAHNTVGFNQWDEVWELGGIGSSNGVPYPTHNAIRAKNFSACLPNTTYYFRGSFAVYWYDNLQVFIKVDYAGNNTKVSPENARYFKIGCYDSYGTTYKNDITINLSWDGERDGEYEEYVKHSYPLDSDLTLRGIPKLDASNNLYYDGDTYESDGTVTRRFGVVDLGTLGWVYEPSSTRFYSSVFDNAMKSAQLKTTLLCTRYTENGSPVTGTNVDKTMWLYSNLRLYINDFAYTDAVSFKTAISGVYLVYELATPTTETADPYTNPQIVDDFGTEEYIDYAVSQGDRDVSIPVGHETQYMANLKAKLEMSPNSPEGAGDYIVRQTNGENEYVTLASNATIQDIIARLEALEGGGE